MTLVSEQKDRFKIDTIGDETRYITKRSSLIKTSPTTADLLWKNMERVVSGSRAAQICKCIYKYQFKIA